MNFLNSSSEEKAKQLFNFLKTSISNENDFKGLPEKTVEDLIK
jgi:hypothetical protein